MAGHMHALPSRDLWAKFLRRDLHDRPYWHRACVARYFEQSVPSMYCTSPRKMMSGREGCSVRPRFERA